MRVLLEPIADLIPLLPMSTNILPTRQKNAAGGNFQARLVPFPD